mmetsp:Transcript_78069/g.123177  ORF Transcript_78069/g.123177 Transcript_78069/m.123177 type:complete len:607 (+) Transcript_78069:44-1864(+)|eukprot:CAMPEP_0169222092 /NCGR_PEP_ID=MMETSP1016-20121227/21402_1 /TAXON_ID=342587 /ORGANISM="Karlodinium micrum, Strain CCMP2283" /LENGTH=606 /DNA_ID=CAMNT_0009300353 /DNA_START=38 /DNA_END=1858 /DNA_ORIENTATION=+
MSATQLLQLPRPSNADGYANSPSRSVSPAGSGGSKKGVKKKVCKIPKGVVQVTRAPSRDRRANAAYTVGSAVRTIKATVMRTSEELDSTDIGEVEVGTECVVKAIGTGTTGRRLLVCISEGPEIEGWISCENAQGDCMLELVAAPVEENNESKEDEDALSAYSLDCSRNMVDVITQDISSDDDKHSPVASRMSEVMTFANATSLGIREEGTWEYICVDPGGIRLRAEPSYTKAKKCGAELKFGEVVKVSSRGVADGLTWLCLADGRGWGFQRTNRLRMSEVAYSEVPADLNDTSFILAPKADALISLEETPIAASSSKSRASSAVPSIPSPSRTSFIDFRGEMSRARATVRKSRFSTTFGPVKTEAEAPQNAVPPGTSIRISNIASVALPSDKGKEAQQNFYHVHCDDGKEGWLLDCMVIPCRTEELDKSSASRWISVTASSTVPVCATPSRRRDTVRSLQPGDFVEVEARCFADDLVFFKLALDGCWICEMGIANKPVVELAFKEAHNWVYVCNDKDGAVLRDTPTRVTSRKAGQKIKQKQRVVVSERAQLASGDVFLHAISPMDGWIPAWKKDHSERKMQQLNEVERDMDAMTLARMLSTVERE